MSTYNSAAFAGLLCQLCGTLAGFAVAGLIFVVALHPREDSQDSPSGLVRGPVRGAGDRDLPVALLTSSFIGLILSALAYALMAGEPAGSARLATDQLIAGAGFGTGALVLLFAVRRLVCGASPSLDRWTRHVVGIGAPCVVWLYLAEGTRYVGSLCKADQGVLWLVLGSTAAVQFLAGVTAFVRPRRAPMPAGGVMRVASTGVAVPTMTTLAVALTPTLLPNDAAAPTGVLYVLLAVSTVGLAYFTLQVGRAPRSEESAVLD